MNGKTISQINPQIGDVIEYRDEHYTTRYTMDEVGLKGNYSYLDKSHFKGVNEHISDFYVVSRPIKVGDSVKATRTDKNRVYRDYINVIGVVVSVNDEYINIEYLDGEFQVAHVDYDCVVKIEKGNNMFVETVTEKKIKKVIDGTGKCGYNYSIEPCGKGVKLVVGAMKKDGFCENFDAESLRELIDGLEEVYKVVK